MTKILKNRLIIVLLCSAMALTALLLYTGSVQSEAKKITVVRAAGNIAKGDLITGDKLETVTIGGYNLDKSVITDTVRVVGQYAAADLFKGEIIMKAHLSDNLLPTGDRLRQLDGSRVAFSVTIKSFAAGLSDKLMAGDIVSVYVDKDKKVTLSPALTYVEVLSATTGKGIDREQREDETENLSTVTLLITPEQAMLLTEYENEAKIHLALVYRGDSAVAKQFLDAQDKMLEGTR